MDVDVIIPVFNGARFVEHAVASVQAQTVDVVRQIICVDDGSSDESRDVLERLASTDPRLTVLAQETNLGVAAARNRGVRHGDAALIAFLDHDDEWLPDKLAAQLEALEQGPDLGYVVGQQQMVLDPGAVRPAWCLPEWLQTPQKGFLPSTLVVRRGCFEHVGPLEERFRAGGDDSDWFARARRLGVPFRHLDRVVMRRRIHGENLSNDRSGSRELLDLVRQHAANRKAQK